MGASDLLDSIAGRTEQAGIFVATAAVPRSFQHTLMPRSTIDQAVITGAGMATQYALAALTHDSIEALAQWARPGLPSETDRAWRRRTAAIDAGAWALGLGLRMAFRQRPGEPLTRGAMRTGGFVLAYTGFSGLSVAALQEATIKLEEATGNARLRRLPLAVLGGALFAAGDQFLSRRRAHGNGDGHLEGEEWKVATGKAMAVGGLVAAGLSGIAAVERGLANGLSRRLTRLLPGRERGWRSVGHALALGAMGWGMTAALHRVYARIDAAASTFEPGGESPPETKFVSGGPGSLVGYETLSNQGRRNVHTYIRPEWIERVMGEQAKEHPIRVFVGLDSAGTQEDRVDLAMKELERTGAFERSLLLVVSPTGTGYVNYVAVESVEFMTRGDCATVTMQYSKRPSPLSLGRIDVGREQNYMLLQAIFEHLQTLPLSDRPRLVLFGESLGAHTSQDAFVHRGTRGLLDREVDRALWIGTPYGSRWKEEVLGKRRYDVDRSMVGVFNDIGELESLDPAQRDKLRYVMLTHHNDAVAYFGPEILLSCPQWLGDPADRPPGVPKSARYGPVVTFLQTLVDMKNSANVIPGNFESKGHDYRADLARFVRAVYGLEATDEQMTRIEEALRQYELARAQWIRDHKEQQQESAQSA
jgi:uncharacterized membrane protein